MSRRLPIALAAAVALLTAGIAAADHGAIRLTKEAQATAHAIVLKRADLPTTGWKGGAKKPNLSSNLPCTSYHPKQSDLVLNGAAETDWTTTGLEFFSSADVLQSPKMVALDWKRTVIAPQVVPCLRSGLVKELGGHGRLVSFKLLVFPRLATYTRAYRAVIDVTSGGSTVPVFVDVVAMGQGRAEVSLTTIAPLVTILLVRPTELRLARLLASRIPS